MLWNQKGFDNTEEKSIRERGHNWEQEKKKKEQRGRGTEMKHMGEPEVNGQAKCKGSVIRVEAK